MKRKIKVIGRINKTKNWSWNTFKMEELLGYLLMNKRMKMKMIYINKKIENTVSDLKPTQLKT